jgi:hypothetical protein
MSIAHWHLAKKQGCKQRFKTFGCAWMMKKSLGLWAGND